MGNDLVLWKNSSEPVILCYAEERKVMVGRWDGLTRLQKMLLDIYDMELAEKSSNIIPTASDFLSFILLEFKVVHVLV